MSNPGPLLLVLDGNSLMHRTYHAGAADAGELDAWALRGFARYAARAVARLRPDAVVVGFDCPEESARRADYPGYKAHRPDKPGELVAQLAAAPGLLRAAGLCTVVPGGYEADDVLASSAAQARRAGWRSILMTSDRDAFALIDDATSVLRIRNGGFDEAVLIDAAGLHELCGVHPHQYLDYAALRGDPSDNLPGVRGFGAAISARLLASLGTVDAAWADLDAGGHAVRAAVGEQAAERLAAPDARQVVARNRRLMRMRADLPIPHLDGARLPLDTATVRAALAVSGGPTLGPALWALTATRNTRVTEPHPPVFRRPQRHRREPSPGQLALF
ncbi:5'-3' exonuclease [Catenuloplanes atrovinosus]|uniref:5'-3' exonuclease n=1 Tax=Catenuloplanes atrovinosus TaxID=137266 RepID=A0AAE3YQH5_9ACTN|nr:5'-3' exonuclease H3TH domain-containing protein [Catenuloplanes atrovinosus]MDR7276781.1 DNA polymerase-1 [Catenuloplanes atrovinosus]